MILDQPAMMEKCLAQGNKGGGERPKAF